MATTEGGRNGHIRELTVEEGHALFDRQARRYLHIGGADFIRKWDAGEFDARAEEAGVMHVVMLLPLGR